jgi:hypothetical protein
MIKKVLNWFGEHWALIVTFILAIYGAVVSTLNLLNVRKKMRRHLNVKMSRGWRTLPQGLSGNLFLIEVSNPGYRSVTIDTPYIRLPYGGNLITPWPTAEVHFPHELHEGKRCILWIEEAEVKRNLKDSGYSGKIELWAEVNDQTGKKHVAKKALVYDINK